MKVTILHPVKHDGKPLEVGSKPDLPADAAKALVALGHADDGKKKADDKSDD